MNKIKYTREAKEQNLCIKTWMELIKKIRELCLLPDPHGIGLEDVPWGDPNAIKSILRIPLSRKKENILGKTPPLEFKIIEELISRLFDNR